MKVLHLDEQMGWRGGEQQASYLIHGLLKRDVQVYAVGRPQSEFSTRLSSLLNENFFSLPLRNEMDLFSVRTLAKFVNENQIDLIHAHTSHAHTLACLTRMFAGRGKVIVSRRVDFEPKRGWINAKKYGWPDHYVAISNAIKNILIDFGIPGKKITMVHSAIDRSRFEVDAFNREAFGVGDGAFIWGNVAHLVPHKDHATLLRAFAEVVRENSETCLFIVGPGALENELKTLSHELGLDDHVKFLGKRDDVPSLLKMFDGYVMSSKEEGLGTSVLDAMASNVPVVGTDAGGLPEMIRNENTGLLAKSENPAELARQMLAMMNDQELRKKVSENARQMIVDEYLVDHMVEGNLAVYKSLMDNE